MDKEVLYEYAKKWVWKDDNDAYEVLDGQNVNFSALSIYVNKAIKDYLAMEERKQLGARGCTTSK